MTPNVILIQTGSGALPLPRNPTPLFAFVRGYCGAARARLPSCHRLSRSRGRRRGGVGCMCTCNAILWCKKQECKNISVIRILQLCPLPHSSSSSSSLSPSPVETLQFAAPSSLFLKGPGTDKPKHRHRHRHRHRQTDRHRHGIHPSRSTHTTFASTMFASLVVAALGALPFFTRGEHTILPSSILPSCSNPIL